MTVEFDGIMTSFLPPQLGTRNGGMIISEQTQPSETEKTTTTCTISEGSIHFFGEDLGICWGELFFRHFVQRGVLKE